MRRLDPARPDPRVLEDAAQALARGGLVVVPTETVYGVAADPRAPGAVERLGRAKGRPEDKPIALLVAGVDEIRRYGIRLDGVAEKLARTYWPGPLTMVLDTPTGATGFRVPDHPVTLGLLRRAGGVLAATSANRSGEPPALTAEDALKALGGAVDMVLDAGPSPGGVPSTVVRVEGARVSILRAGAIAEQDIREMVNG